MGIWANRTPSQQPLAMNIALGLSLLGIVGSLRGIPDFITILGGGTVERPVATMAQFATVFICLGFSIRWLAERRRKA
jgi:predicted ABC-type sugar transport system permease subunit